MQFFPKSPELRNSLKVKHWIMFSRIGLITVIILSPSASSGGPVSVLELG